MPSLRLPPRSVVTKPDADDPVDYYYRRLTAPLYRGRLRHALALLGDGPFDALLEVGYGAGLFIPELAARTRRLVGIDVHGARAGVEGTVAALGLDVELVDASLYDMPFADGEFDAAVYMSVLEHLRDLDGALTETARVLRPGGVLIVGVPVRNLATSSFFRIVGYDPAEIHPSSHRDVEAALARHPGLELERRSVFPRALPADLAAYTTFRAGRR